MTRVYVAAVLVAVVAGGCSTGTPLFNGKDLTGWVEIDSDGSWTVSDGVLRCSGEKKEGSYSWLSTDRKYADFELTMDWRIEPGTNAGVFLRAPSRKGRISKEGFEVQIKDDGNDADFTDVSGSESPAWFAPEGEEPRVAELSWGRQNWFPWWQAEHRACRESVVLFDQDGY